MLEEDNKTAETTVETEVDSHADINQKTEDVNEVEFQDSSEGEAQPKQEELKKSTNEQNNSENARRRREAERQKELKEAREQAIIDALGGKNPYTGEEMKDSADVEEFLTMKEIEKEGGDPLTDFSKFHKTKEKEKAAKLAEDAAKTEWYRKDREEFATKHPEVNVETLVQDKQFQLFASGKVGRLPLSEIYEGFIEVVGEFEEKAKRKASQLLANAKSTPGALASPNPPEETFFSKERVQKMTPEEVHKHYDKIRASMPKWK